jgi:putative ATP-dependent endonuclease of OLD family
MRLRFLRMVNFRCYDDVTIDCAGMHAIVGTNSAGKSTVLYALDFLFNPSAASISRDLFHKHQTQNEIRIEVIFVDLSDEESEAFRGYLFPDGSFRFARTAKWVTNGLEGKVEIGQSYNSPQPIAPWLNPVAINADSIKQWAQQTLSVNGASFSEYLAGEKRVAQWKEKAAEFAAQHLTPHDYQDVWNNNPKGFTNVLKGNLPHFELVRAVRDVEDEGKVGKTNPFGKLIQSILDNLDPNLKAEIELALATTTKKLNRGAGESRIKAVSDVEDRLKQYVAEIIPADVELEFQCPNVESVLSFPNMMINDGFRGPVQYKGHGLQRAMIVSILRAYADLVTSDNNGKRRKLILGVEEPELYMHPPMLRSLRRVLRKIADGGDQVFFTTHSPAMVDVGFFDEIIRVEAANAGGSARIHQIRMDEMIADVEARWPGLKGKVTASSMRERYSHVYTSTRSEGFFAKKVILVEGQTELYCLPIYAFALGYDFDNLGVIVVECGTKDQIDRLYRIFNELRIPAYVLFDFDLGGKAEENSRKLLKCLGIKPDTAGGAAVTNRYACFAQDWEKDLRAQIQDYDKLEAEATAKLGLRPDTGKPLRARYVAQELTSREKPFVPESITGIIEQAVQVKFSGTCLQK